MSHYKALGIPQWASIRDVKKAYRELARRHHPDKGGDPKAFLPMKEAYEVLTDPLLRARYDAQLGNAWLQAVRKASLEKDELRIWQQWEHERFRELCERYLGAHHLTGLVCGRKRKRRSIDERDVKRRRFSLRMSNRGDRIGEGTPRRSCRCRVN